MEFQLNNVKISDVRTYSTKKSGEAFISKFGKPYNKVTFKISPNEIDADGFDGYLSVLDFDNIASQWKDGDLISGKVSQNGDFWNFDLPRTDPRSQVIALEKENKELKERIEELESGKVPCDDDGSIDDLPF